MQLRREGKHHGCTFIRPRSITSREQDFRFGHYYINRIESPVAFNAYSYYQTVKQPTYIIAQYSKVNLNSQLIVICKTKKLIIIIIIIKYF